MAALMFHSNMFYRITNAALGNSSSLEATNPAIGLLSGWVDIAATSSDSGQLWQISSSNNTSNGGYYLINSLLGPQKRLDVAINHNRLWVPFVKTAIMYYDQAWNISAAGNSTYTMAPNRLSGTKFMSENATTDQPFLADEGTDGEQWIVTPVMEINNVSFSAAAELPSSTSLVSMAISKTTITTTTMATSTTTPITTVSPLVPTSSSTPAAENGTAEHVIVPKSALAAIIVAPITLLVALVILATIIIISRRKARRCVINNQNISRPLMQRSGSEVNIDSHPPLARSPSSLFGAASLESSEETTQMPYPAFSPLSPRPPLPRNRSWEERGLQPIWGSSALGIDGDLPSPLSPGPARNLAASPVELPAAVVTATRSQTPDVSPLTSNDSLHELENRPTSALNFSRSFKRPVSLISRWKL